MTREAASVVLLVSVLLVAGAFVTEAVVREASAQDAPGPGPEATEVPSEDSDTSALLEEVDDGLAEDAVHEQPETFLEFAVAGGYLMIPLTLCSIFWLSFLVERLLFLHKAKVIPQELSVAFRSLSKEVPLDRGKASALLEEHPSSLAVVLRAALAHLNQGRDEIERSVNNAAQRETYLLRKNIRIFAVIASVAPLIGLLGTVMGLVQAFREVAISGLGSSGAALAPGIYQALITTVAGLVVAIPCLLTYYWLMARIDHYVHEMDNLLEDFVEAHGGAPAPAARKSKKRPS